MRRRARSTPSRRTASTSATPRTLVGVAGTVTTVATLLLGLDTWDRDRVHHATFPVAEVHALGGPAARR